MRIYSEEALDALDSGDVRESGAIRLSLPDGPWCVWGGYGDITIDTENYVGLGNRGFITGTGALGASEETLTLTLSGVEPEVINNIDFPGLNRAPIVIWRLIFNGAGTRLLHVERYRAGRVTKGSTTKVVGGPSTITIEVIGAIAGAGRSLGRMCSDADQRRVKANDGSKSRRAYAPSVTLYWGGELPASLQQMTPAGIVAHALKNILK